MNMLAYSLQSVTKTYAFSYFRVVFHIDDDFVPAILCKDFFAEEIQAEASGASNSTFYSDNYGKNLNAYSDWVCPDIDKETLSGKQYKNLVAFVLNCETGKKEDAVFMPD